MECERFDELISAYVDNEVTDNERAILEKHIKECDICREKVDTLMYIKNVIGSIDNEAIPVHISKKKLYGKIYKYLFIVFACLVLVFSLVAISGGIVQLFIIGSVPALLRYVFFGGIAFILLGLLILQYDVLVDMIKVIFKKK